MLSSVVLPKTASLRMAMLTVLVGYQLVAQVTGVPHDAEQAYQGPTASAYPEYQLGPDDLITVFVADMPDEFADKTFRIDTAGDISLPVIGHLHAGGLTTAQLEEEAVTSLKRILKNPQVSISIYSFGSESVSVLGAVNLPAIRQLEGHKTLFEMLSAAGGLRPDAGYVVKVTRSLQRGEIPLPDVTVDQVGHTSTATIRLKDIINATNSAENIAVLPGDAISVPPQQLVYAVGSVVKPGAFPLGDHESLSALQVVALAEGLDRTAKSSKAEILRLVPGSKQRAEIAVNLKQLMKGGGADVTLQADDILFVPSSAGKAAGYRTIESVVTAATGIAIYGRY